MYTIIQGDCIEQLKKLPADSVHCCITSPPYLNLRSYKTATWEGGNETCDHKAGETKQNKDACQKCGAIRVDRQIGIEETPQKYVQKMMEVFREVRRVLHPTGVLWLNLGDSYCSYKGDRYKHAPQNNGLTPKTSGYKCKDLMGVPWLVARELQKPYYTGTIKSEQDRAWLAATIDAEGSICGFHHQRKDTGAIRTGIHINITNSNNAMLNNASRIWPASITDHPKSGEGHLGNLDMFRWIAHDVNKKSLLLQELYPYLVCKRQQAMLAWNFLEFSKISKRLGKTPQGADMKKKRSELIRAISELNHARTVNIPDWCIEPPSLYEDGWYLRSALPWIKRSATPESILDRPTSAVEYVFLFSKSQRYFFDMEAVKVLHKEVSVARWHNGGEKTDNTKFVGENAKTTSVGNLRNGSNPLSDNGRLYRNTDPFFESWQGLYEEDGNPLALIVNTVPSVEEHFASYPEKLVQPLVKSGTSEHGCCPKCLAPFERVIERQAIVIELSDRGKAKRADGLQTAITGKMVSPPMSRTTGWKQTCSCKGIKPRRCIVLDPFGGTGTTGRVAEGLGRDSVMIELSTEYLEIMNRRTAQENLL